MQETTPLITKAALTLASGVWFDVYPFPDKPFYLVGASATEEKKSVWDKDREMILGFNNSSKAVDTKAHVSTPADNVDVSKLFWVSISKHGAPPG